jgi:hypothetical protein
MSLVSSAGSDGGSGVGEGSDGEVLGSGTVDGPFVGDGLGSAAGGSGSAVQAASATRVTMAAMPTPVPLRMPASSQPPTTHRYGPPFHI